LHQLNVLAHFCGLVKLTPLSQFDQPLVSANEPAAIVLCQFHQQNYVQPFLPANTTRSYIQLSQLYSMTGTRTTQISWRAKKYFLTYPRAKDLTHSKGVFFRKKEAE